MSQKAALRTADIVLVSGFWGPLPSYFPAWLESCRHNRSIKWAFFTDQDLSSYDIPDNVDIYEVDLDAVALIFSEAFGLPVGLARPYKMCDFRPFLWILLDHFGVEYSHWGHADIDVVYGRFEDFITPDLVNAHRMFEFGHLSIYKRSTIARAMPFHPKLAGKWLEAICSSSSIGFDERNGVNIAWAEFRDIWHVSSHDIYDIEPRVGEFAPARGTLLPRPTAFVWQDGVLKVIEHRRWRGPRERELLYVHFQKRLMPILGTTVIRDGFLLSPHGITPVPAAIAQPTVEGRFTVRERARLARNWLRARLMHRSPASSSVT